MHKCTEEEAAEHKHRNRKEKTITIKHTYIQTHTGGLYSKLKQQDGRKTLILWKKQQRPLKKYEHEHEHQKKMQLKLFPLLVKSCGVGKRACVCGNAWHAILFLFRVLIIFSYHTEDFSLV